MIDEPRSGRARPRARKITVDQRRHIRIDDGRAPALELAISGRTSEDTDTSQPLRAGSRRVFHDRHCVGMQKTHGHDLGAALLSLTAMASIAASSSAASTSPSASSRSRTPKGEPALHERSRRRHKDVVQLGARLAANADHILEAFGGDERNRCSFALEHRVGRDGRSVNDFGGSPARALRSRPGSRAMGRRESNAACGRRGPRPAARSP